MQQYEELENLCQWEAGVIGWFINQIFPFGDGFHRYATYISYVKHDLFCLNLTRKFVT